MDNCSIYVHISPENHIYIGQTVNIKARWFRSAYRANPYFQNVINKFGWNNLEHKVIASGLSHEDANVMEIALIKRYRNDPKYKVLNLTEGGLGHKGYDFPDESKNKLSKMMVGRVKITNGVEDKMVFESDTIQYIERGWWRGTCRKLNEQQRQDIVRRQTGVKHSETRRKNNSITQRQFIWVNDGKTNARIKKNLLEKYLGNGFVRGVIHKNNPSGCTWINNGVESKLVKNPQEYIQNGWKIGMHNGGNGGANKGKIRISKNGVKKYVPSSELETYLNNGWIKGWNNGAG